MNNSSYKEGPYNYDEGSFTLWLSKYGVWKSADPEGKGIVSGIDKETVVFWSREHINGFQNSWVSDTNISCADGYKL